MMSTSIASLQPLSRIVGYARYVFGGLLLLTIVLITWQRVGMETVVELTGDRFQVWIEDDRTSSEGGASVGSIEKRGRDLVVRCHIVPKYGWPYCKLAFNLLKGTVGMDMSTFDYMTIDGHYAGAGNAGFSLVLSQAEEGLTRLDQWETFKVHQIDKLDLPADGTLRIPLKWFAVAPWWKDMVKPTMEHAAVNVDNVARVELLIKGDGKDGEHVFTLRGLQLHGKVISSNTLLMGLVSAWVLCAVGWLAAVTLSLRTELKDRETAIALLKEVNEALELEARDLAGQAHIDPLTGALNRQGLRAALMSTSSLLADPMAVVFIDIDHFKSINDTHGHAAGDHLLRAFADCVRITLRKTDLAFRYGGDEFVIALPQTGIAQAQAVVNKLRQAFAAVDFSSAIANLDHQPTLSIGVTERSKTNSVLTLAQLLNAADQALYDAKSANRNCIRIYQPTKAA
jgi:diguanylate cyclase (GGDEF)-like protein